MPPRRMMKKAREQSCVIEHGIQALVTQSPVGGGGCVCV